MNHVLISAICIPAVILLSACSARSADTPEGFTPVDRSCDGCTVDSGYTDRDGRNFVKFISEGGALRRINFYQRHEGREGLLEQRRYVNGTKSGLHTMWHASGAPKWQGNYEDGLLDGWVYHWDGEGNTLGCYEMDAGTGVVKMHYSNGAPKLYEEYRSGDPHGILVSYGQNGALTGYAYNHEGVTVRAFAWTSDGRVKSLTVNSREHADSGIAVIFNNAGNVTTVAFFLNGVRVDRDVYLSELNDGKSLPRPQVDRSAYEQMVPDPAGLNIPEW